jgi:hypothetical protein
MSLRKRLSIATALVVLVTVSALAVAAYAIAGHELRTQVDDSLATRADAIVRQIDRELQRPQFFDRQRAPLGPTLLQPEFDAIRQNCRSPTRFRHWHQPRFPGRAAT